MSCHIEITMTLNSFATSVYKIMWSQFVPTLYPVMVLTCRRGIFHRTLKAVQLIVSSWMSNGGLRRSDLCKHMERNNQRWKHKTYKVKSNTVPQAAMNCLFVLLGKGLLNQEKLMLKLYSSLWSLIIWYYIALHYFTILKSAKINLSKLN